MAVTSVDHFLHHYSSPKLFTFLAKQQGCYIVHGLGGNMVLEQTVDSLITEVKQKAAGYRCYQSFLYQAQSWSALRNSIS